MPNASTMLVPQMNSWLGESIATGHLTNPDYVSSFLVPKQEPPPVSRPKREKSEPKNPRAGKKAKIETPKSEPVPLHLQAAFDAADKGQIILSKEELLNLTSTQHEEFLSRVRANRDLSTAEKQNVKRQRRLIKNRESAQASRQRKKNYVEELEKKLADLQQDNNKLNQTISNLSTENLFLKNQVESLKPTIPSITPVLNRPMPMYKPPTYPVLGSGFLVLVILFSFGLLLGNIGIPTGALNFENVAPVTTRILDREGFKQLSNPQGFESLLHENPAIPFVGRLQGRKLNQGLGSGPVLTQKLIEASQSIDLEELMEMPSIEAIEEAIEPTPVHQENVAIKQETGEPASKLGSWMQPPHQHQ